jgi:hypothetical protein
VRVGRELFWVIEGCFTELFRRYPRPVAELMSAGAGAYNRIDIAMHAQDHAMDYQHVYLCIQKTK